LKVLGELPDKFKTLMGGKDGRSRNQISIAFGNDGELDLSLGLVREGECGFWRTAKPFPPTAKGRMFAMH
jgi:hypothetical protein